MRDGKHGMFDDKSAVLTTVELETFQAVKSEYNNVDICIEEAGEQCEGVEIIAAFVEPVGWKAN